jgi:hypothetical protein
VLEQIDREWLATGTAPRVRLFHGSRMPWNLYEHDRLSRLTQRPVATAGMPQADIRFEQFTTVDAGTSRPQSTGQAGDNQ